ncbi:SDR family oxidoreductase [Salinibacterium sp. NK8237]|uniref:SDR family oxidoreductase n=1 Tax=Salinibacterium sp. NK8237 TaxID=2792038 RepID=UPI0018CD47C1|nr:NAD(P)H-binding protein [Salinibacterium sp. NK8237]MBH0129217.1 NAD(P)H-binding protein [Salinibacterium sp. NK8237]
MILVTGATGTLGRPTVSILEASGHSVRALSRQPGPGRVVGDLSTGAGLTAALSGVTTVIHLATGANTHDSHHMRQLLRAIAAHPIDHLIFMSIVGVDRHALGYYRDKYLSEEFVVALGVPYTILRATQFHSFVAKLFTAQRRSPVTLVPAFSMQPVAVEDVTQRLVELVDAGPSGHVPDFGGPEQLHFRELARQWNAAHSVRKPVWSLPVPGAVGRAFARGVHRATLPGDGRTPFAAFAEADARSAAD